ncbi:hypothetical protein HC891_14570 [Candidatus Gracilibacteria bacterium]|nr:hypothetical protein [Candidatus Gracilibacteria bacterium]
MLTIVVGADSSDEAQGKLQIMRGNRISYEIEPLIEHRTPTKHGALTITSVQLPIVDLVAADGTPFRFDLDSETWVDP